MLELAGGGRRARVVLPDLAEPEAGAELQLQLFEAVSRLLAASSSERPLMVIIEDLHWSDDSTRSLLRFLCTTWAGRRLDHPRARRR